MFREKDGDKTGRSADGNPLAAPELGARSG
jgi:hypothetical protein